MNMRNEKINHAACVVVEVWGGVGVDGREGGVDGKGVGCGDEGLFFVVVGR